MASLIGRWGTVAVPFFFVPLCLAAGPAGGVPAGGPAIIMDTTGPWRMHNVLKPPVVADGEALRPIISCGASGVRGGAYWQKLLAQETPAPPADWTKADFDDGPWVRGTAVSFCRTPYLARLCLRGRFTVTDTAKVKPLTLTIGYYGGVAVWLNGREIGRKHLPAGAAAAEAYPRDVFVDEAGKPIALRGLEYLIDKDKLSPALAKRIEQRLRVLEVQIPPGAIRQGTNVLAIEIVRAPYDKVLDEQKVILDSHGKYEVHDLSWNTCELRHVQLRAPVAEGLVGGATRPDGVQVWNSDVLSADFDVDFGAPGEELRPIRLAGAKNGVYSGKVVVGSNKAIKSLHVTASDLAGKDGKIPASAIQIRYALPWGSVPLTNASSYEPIPYPADATPLAALAEAPLAEFPIRKKPLGRQEIGGSNVTLRRFGLGNQVPLTTPGAPAPVFGAVVPVWVTVRVPKDAKPGVYTGKITITEGSAAQAAAVAEPAVELKVMDWTLPDPYESRSWVELIESPDTTAVEYGLPLWSPRHWEMVSKSLAFLGEMGSKVLYVPLIAETNVGNAQSMVRWVRKGEDKFEYDFSIMDKYLDLAEKQAGKPRFVVFNVWDRCLLRQGAARRKPDGYKLAKDGPLVTFLNADGNTENVMLADYPEPEAKAQWTPLFQELRRRMAKRGLEKAMILGMVSDFWATKEQAAALKEITGDLPWLNACHYFQETFHGGLASFAYQATYFGARQGFGQSLRGWRGAYPHAAFERIPLDNYPIARWRLLVEQCITGNNIGIGRLGADTWLAVRDKTGARAARVWQRYPAADWGYLNANSSTLAAGPEGPVATTRFEALREGRQECEAIILLEEALGDAARKTKLGDDLARRCDELLKERNLCMWRAYICWQNGPKANLDATGWRENGSPTGNTWFLGSGWQERSERLYQLTGEVEKKLAAK